MARDDYFKALRLPIVAGRVYDERDTPDRPNVALINEAAARQLIPNGDMVGRRVRIGPDPKAAWTAILYGVAATDVVTFLVVAVGLIVVVSLACLIPASRATRVDPITSLRAE